MPTPLIPFRSTQHQNTKIEPSSARTLLHLAPPGPDWLLPVARNGPSLGPDRLWKRACTISLAFPIFFRFRALPGPSRAYVQAQPRPRPRAGPPMETALHNFFNLSNFFRFRPCQGRPEPMARPLPRPWLRAKKITLSY